MPFLNNITESINGIILSSTGIPVADAKLFDISEVMIEAGNNDEGNALVYRYPSVIDMYGEVTRIIIDDGYALIAYHKVENVANGIDQKSGYGNSRGNIVEVANMALMVYAFRRKVKREAWWIEAMIKDKLPDTLNISDRQGKLLQRSVVRPVMTSYDKLGLLQREYTEVQLNYPDLMVFEMKYRVESTWSKGCFSNCSCDAVSGTINN
jgi:hypothetical protein